ncbi:immunoglobulin-like domain-containing protein [Microbulbifer agarilyticus]|uniref:immunoglobulin-like domain-containing protein n=1 Tax=Microbulbifer agarilyticus TaxID=260552 RepID=UPI001CD41F9C|nr:immunoglobulin-like domain-containing protein [Microbulbifer agarilyticus]MCA0894909.1 DUF5011 domain-containing protein [Microbulbifer agarilyticus]
MFRYSMYVLIMLICTGCGGWNPPDPGDGDTNSPPEIRLIGANNVQLHHGEAYEDAGATANDNEDGDLTDQIVVTGLPITSNVPGNYVIGYRVTDSDGESASIERLVNVAENNAPTINLNGAASLEVEENTEFSDPGATANDAEDGNLNAKIDVTGEVDTATAGTYELSYSVTDSAGATAETTRMVTVVQASSPFSHIPITIEKAGFTTILPASDSRLIYVSSSTGDNANDGLTPETAVNSITRGKDLLRDGSPDWLLLKIGDEWQEGLGKWLKSGRSASEPMVVTAYGEGTKRPLLMSGTKDGLRASGGGGSPQIIDNLVFSGLHLYSETRDPDSSSFTQVSTNRGINWYRGCSYLLFEDNYIEHYKEGIQIHDLDNLDISGVVIRRNVIVDSYATDAHSQGIYVSQTEGVLIEENIFDHNGWHATYPGAVATKFNHSIYIQSDNTDIDIKNNIISRSSSHGMQLRPGGIIEGNFLIRNPISILLGRATNSPSDGQIINNVVLNGNDIGPGDLRRGWGIDFNTQNNGLVKNNIVAHVMSDASNRFAIKESENATYINNIVYKWEEGTDDPGNYIDPERTIEEFDQLMGGAGTYDSFIGNIRAQSRLTWNPDYSVGEIRQFFIDGFSEQ